MKNLLLMLLIAFTVAPVFAKGKWEGVTAYGSSLEHLISRYDNHSNGKEAHIGAVIDFTHMYYGNYVALEMAKKTHIDKPVFYYCLTNAAKSATDELELFISWSKLKIASESSLSSQSIVSVYPIYLMDMYPLTECESNN
ncbi:hypothetical protein H4J38_04310 [Colwellia sp. BRX10-3]|uniref:hypothetical protein n=1 Tax=Colwellia sp. BRX10-3 TaxID=2759844 RepID=UPI0015F3837F|nr:hypothetical protein [Colwellia sp. BRX10-3]MBA6390002.1 hypothetical protein [Colwellia sp. BRX10-3]